MPTENKQAEPFQREDRYIVIKRSDIERLAPGNRRVATRNLRDIHEELFKAGSPARSFVVVEDDWPEYHLVWAMIEHRMTGKPVPDFNLWRRADELQQRLNAADQRIDELVELLRDAGGAVNGHAMTAWAIPLAKKIAVVVNHAESGASERCHEIPGTSGMRLNMLANQGE